MDAVTFKMRFPEFNSVPNQLVSLILAEAIPQVGINWLERDRLPATLYLTAHLLALQGEPSRSNAIAAGGTGTNNREIKRRKVGDVEVEYVTSSSGSASGMGAAVGFAASIYGQQFAALRRRNFPAIAVA